MWACLRRRLLSLKYLRVIALAVRLKSTLVTAGCASEMLPLNCDPRAGEMSIWSHQTDKASFAKGSILFLVSVALVAAVDVVLFSVASISLLGGRACASEQKRYPAGTSTSTNVRLTRRKSTLFQWLAVPLWVPTGKDSVPTDSGGIPLTILRSAIVNAVLIAIENRVRLSERIGQFMN